MPCYDNYDNRSDPEWVRKESQGQIDELTSLLCAVGKVMKYVPAGLWPPRFVVWYNRHQRLDREREEKEKRIVEEQRLRQ